MPRQFEELLTLAIKLRSLLPLGARSTHLRIAKLPMSYTYQDW